MTGLTAFEIEEWLVDRIADATGQDRGAIDRHAPFETFGIDSANAVALSGEIEDLVDREMAPTLLYEHTCIHDLSVALHDAAAGTPR